MKHDRIGGHSHRGPPLSFVSSRKRAQQQLPKIPDDYFIRLAQQEADYFNMLHEQEEPNVPD